MGQILLGDHRRRVLALLEEGIAEVQRERVLHVDQELLRQRLVQAEVVA